MIAARVGASAPRCVVQQRASAPRLLCRATSSKPAVGAAVRDVKADMMAAVGSMAALLAAPEAMASDFQFNGYAGAIMARAGTSQPHASPARLPAPPRRPSPRIPVMRARNPPADPPTPPPAPAGASSSYWTVLGLFVMSVPGLWSVIKRATKTSAKRKTYEVDGPAVEGSKEMGEWAKDITKYFIKYNYAIKEMGEVVTFEGTYQASKSQAFALSAYTLFSLASVALVLSTIFPDVGNWWYAMCLVSPAAGYYYWTNGTRNEQCKVKLVASDDDKTIDIVVEGDIEELERFAAELNVVEKGKVRVKGLLESA